MNILILNVTTFKELIMYVIKIDGALIGMAMNRPQLLIILRREKLLAEGEMLPDLPKAGKRLIMMRPFHALTKHLKCATRSFTIDNE